MKKVILSILLLSSFSYADKLSDVIEKQCEYNLYGKGNNDEKTQVYLHGLVAGMRYVTPLNQHSISSKKNDSTKIINIVCKVIYLQFKNIRNFYHFCSCIF
jgi:hypothetical protein